MTCANRSVVAPLQDFNEHNAADKDPDRQLVLLDEIFAAVVEILSRNDAKRTSKCLPPFLPSFLLFHCLTESVNGINMGLLSPDLPSQCVPHCQHEVSGNYCLPLGRPGSSMYGLHLLDLIAQKNTLKQDVRAKYPAPDDRCAIRDALARKCKELRSMPV